MRSQTQSQDRASLYDDVTGRIVAELEQGTVPWVKPWASAGAALGLPRSAATRRNYSGINILILWDAVIERGFASQDWLTFRQALSLGGHVRKGERGAVICYADRFIPKGERERAREQGEDPNAVPFLKRFTVFNVEQCDGLPGHVRPKQPVLSEVALCPDAERLITATRAHIVEGAGEAFHHRGDDLIRIPSRETFVSTSDFYCTVLHELGHNAVIRIMPHTVENARLAA